VLPLAKTITKDGIADIEEKTLSKVVGEILGRK
jgi:hypothetical protein